MPCGMLQMRPSRVLELVLPCMSCEVEALCIGAAVIIQLFNPRIPLASWLTVVRVCRLMINYAVGSFRPVPGSRHTIPLSVVTRSWLPMSLVLRICCLTLLAVTLTFVPTRVVKFASFVRILRIRCWPISPWVMFVMLMYQCRLPTVQIGSLLNLSAQTCVGFIPKLARALARLGWWQTFLISRDTSVLLPLPEMVYLLSGRTDHWQLHLSALLCLGRDWWTPHCCTHVSITRHSTRWSK